MMANFSLVWEPPFTLNLTNVYPDIIYCVDVYNVSCADRQHLVSNCSLTEPTYRYGYNRQQTDLLEYIVIPRSNVQNARNGTPQVLTGTFITYFNVIIASVSLHHLQRNTYSSMLQNSQPLSLKVILK